MSRAFLVLVGLAACAVACGRPSGNATGGAPSASASAPASAPTTSAATGAAPPAASASAAAAGATRAWKGGYKSAAATLSVPPDLAKTHWSDTKSTAGLGEGTVTLTIEGGSGRARGTIDGPVGPATIDGLAADGQITASVRRQDPTDRGFTGTLVGTVKDDKIEGAMSLSPGQAGVLRTASFTLAPDTAAR